jgi:hypothetical protein
MDISRRAGLLSTVNLVPLVLGSHMNSIVNGCGLGYDAYGTIHRWTGWVTVVDGLIHVVLAVILEKPSLDSSSQVAALVVRHSFLKHRLLIRARLHLLWPRS